MFFCLFPILLCVSYLNQYMCHIVLQRLPAVLSRIGIILASPLVSYHTISQIPNISTCPPRSTPHTHQQALFPRQLQKFNPTRSSERFLQSFLTYSIYTFQKSVQYCSFSVISLPIRILKVYTYIYALLPLISCFLVFFFIFFVG